MLFFTKVHPRLVSSISHPFRHFIRRQHDGIPYYEAKIGKREIVGPGINNIPLYHDSVAFPFPSIRYKEMTPELLAIREKEKGDWSKLTVDEKKILYRASFCLTFSEMKAPTGEWKGVLGWGLVLISIGVWYFMAISKWLHTPRPDTFSDERKAAQLRRILDLRVDPVDGISSEWDYEADDWKPVDWKAWIPKFYW